MRWRVERWTSTGIHSISASLYCPAQVPSSHSNITIRESDPGTNGKCDGGAEPQVFYKITDRDERGFIAYFEDSQRACPGSLIAGSYTLSSRPLRGDCDKLPLKGVNFKGEVHIDGTPGQVCSDSNSYGEYSVKTLDLAAGAQRLSAGSGGCSFSLDYSNGVTTTIAGPFKPENSGITEQFDLSSLDYLDTRKFDLTWTSSEVNLLANTAAVASGYTHSCAVVAEGVKCWGSSANGILGAGAITGDFPSPVVAISSNSQVSSVSAGYRHSCAVVSGGVKCWGYGSQGQIGNGATTNSNTAVEALAASSSATAVSAGYNHTCALVDGGVKCWGYGAQGQIGNNGTTQQNSPVVAIGANSGVSSVSAGISHTCAVVSGGVKCWGAGANGRIGNGLTANSLIPVSVKTNATTTLSGATSASAGGTHSCAVVSGVVMCWGDGANGRLGNGTTGQQVYPVSVTGISSGATYVSAGNSHTCAVVSGGVKCWGAGANGRLGNGSTADSLTPVDVSLATTESSFVTSVSAGNTHTCAVFNTGAVKCWGEGTNGKLGDGAAVERQTPVTAGNATIYSCDIEFPSGL